jgi:hypothetical protein
MDEPMTAPDYDNFALIVGEETLSMPKDILGDIWVWTPEFEFPERGWTDLAAQVANAFLLEAYMLLGGRRRSSIWFMRGPYLVEMAIIDEDTWSVEGVFRGASRTPAVAVRRSVVIAQVLDAGRALLKCCQRRGWKPKSVVSLEVGVARSSARPRSGWPKHERPTRGPGPGHHEQHTCIQARR